MSRLAFGSCAKQGQPQPIWDAIARAWSADGSDPAGHDEAAKPQVWVWAGDNVYNDTQNLDEMRENWAWLSAQPGYAAVRKSTRAVLGTWDDHDFGKNDAGAEYPKRAESQQVFLDFLGVSSDLPRRQREGVYHAATFGPLGQRLQVIVLDTRYHRSELTRYPAVEGERYTPYRPDADEDKTLLGQAQWTWLEAQLREPANVRLIVSSIQFASDEHPFEKWGNLPRERARMLRLIDDTGAAGVIFLSGDRHHAELSRLERNAGYPIYDLTSSGLNQSRVRDDEQQRPLEPNPHRLGRIFRGHHFGTVNIDWDQPDPVITLSIQDQLNQHPIRHSLQLSELQAPTPAPRFGNAEANEPLRPGRLTIDGDPADWPAGRDELIAADDRFVYIRFQTPDFRTLPRHGETVRILINGDGSRDTGLSDAMAYGTDLSLEFGVPADEDDPASDYASGGPRVNVHRGNEAEAVSTAQIDLHAQPTFAAQHFEVRFDRNSNAAIQAGLNRAGPVEITIAGRDLTTDRQRVFMAGTGLLPALGEPASPDAADDGFLPDKPADALRFVVWNVLWAQPQENPESFARIFRALDADVLLLQEWDRFRYREAEIEQWFTQHVDPEATWSSMVTGSGGSGSGTAVVSPHPLIAALPSHSPVEADRWDFPARIAGAAFQTPQGRVVATSVHFKAGGFLNHPTDTRRLAEADAANQLTRGLIAATRPDLIVFAGDFNMNGTTGLIHRALRGLDLDQSVLTLALPTQLGDPQLVYTFGRGPNKRRLDYLAYSDATAEVVHAFALDTQRLSDAALARHGLGGDDAHASDHFPVVVDLKITHAPNHPAAKVPAVSDALP